MNSSAKGASDWQFGCTLSSGRSCLLNLFPENALQCDSISSEFADTFAKLLDCHLFLVEVEAEGRLIVDVASLGDIQRSGGGSIELLWDRVLGVVQVLQQIR